MQDGARLPKASELWAPIRSLAANLGALANQVSIEGVDDSVLVTEFAEAKGMFRWLQLWSEGKHGYSSGPLGYLRNSGLSVMNPGTVYRLEYPDSHWSNYVPRNTVNAPTHTDEDVKIATNLVLSMLDQMNEEYALNLEAFSKGAYPHVLNWDPASYAFYVGDTQPPYKDVAPAGNFTSWEPFTGVVDNANNVMSRRYPQRIPILRNSVQGLLPSYNETTVTPSVGAAYMAAWASLKSKHAEWLDFYLSDTYQSKMVYSNTIHPRQYLSGVMSESEILAYQQLMLAYETSYTPEDCVWNVRRKANAPIQANIPDVINNYEFFKDCRQYEVDGETPRVLLDRLYDAGFALSDYSNEMIDVALENLKVDPDWKDDPIVGAQSTLSRTEKLNQFYTTYDYGTNGAGVNFEDLYPGSGTVPFETFAADGGTVVRYTKADFDAGRRDPEFFTELTTAEIASTDLTQYVLYPKFDPMWCYNAATKAKCFYRVYSDLFDADGAYKIKADPTECVTDADKMELETNLVTFGNADWIKRPTRASWLAEMTEKGNNKRDDQTYHQCFGYYWNKLHQEFEAFKYRKYIYENIFPTVFTAEQQEFFNKAIYIPTGGRYTGYGYTGGEGTYKHDSSRHLFGCRMRTDQYAYIYGSLVSVGVKHEWLMGHAMVRPLQTFLAEEAEMSWMRKYTTHGGHGEGFTNSLELNVADGVYNKVTGFDAEGYAILGSEADAAIVLSALITQARLGPRCAIDIGMLHKGETWAWGQQKWIDEAAGSIRTTFQSRSLSNWNYQMCNYFPAALFVIGAEQKYRADLGDAFDYKEFFQVAVIEALQPARIEAMDVALQLWGASKTAGSSRRLQQHDHDHDDHDEHSGEGSMTLLLKDGKYVPVHWDELESFFTTHTFKHGKHLVNNELCNGCPEASGLDEDHDHDDDDDHDEIH